VKQAVSVTWCSHAAVEKALSRCDVICVSMLYHVVTALLHVCFMKLSVQNRSLATQNISLYNLFLILHHDYLCSLRCDTLVRICYLLA